MESLNPQQINSRFQVCYMKETQRTINDLNSRHGSAVQPRDSNFQGESSSHAESPAMILISGGGHSDEGEKISRNSAPLHGSISVIGRRRVMKDTVAVAKLDSYHFFAVYDGHGGSSVSNACPDRLHQLLAQELEPWIRRGGGGMAVDWEKVMAACFTKMDDEVSGGGGGPEGEDSWVNTVGSSAVVVVVGKEEVVVANSGNSRAVLSRDGMAVALSRDHSADRPDEKERVEAAGGRVINWNGCRVLGVLATSRSIGDHYLKPYVISEPEVTISDRTESCDFLLIASDGLWDVVSNEFACQVVRRCLGAQNTMGFTDGLSGTAAANAAALLAQLALSRGSKDNITVVVVQLNSAN